MDFGSLAIGLLGSFLTAGGLFYAAAQLKLTAAGYAASEQWKRTEFARQLIDKLATDDELAFCTRALDWAVGPLVIPARHRALFSDDLAVVEHNLELLYRALRPDLAISSQDWQGLTYRYSFDAFFSYLETVIHYVTTGVVSKQQLVGLDYYLDLVKAPRYLKHIGDGDAFRPFLERFYGDLFVYIWPPATSDGPGEPDSEAT